MAELSRMARDLLASNRFLPIASGYLIPSFLADQLDCTEAGAAEYLQELAGEGFIQQESEIRFASREPHFRTTLRGWQASEALRRKLRQRRPPLLDQRSYLLGDLLLGLAYEPYAFNERLKGGMLAADCMVPLQRICVYLADWSENEIRQECAKLAGDRLVELGKTRFYDKEVEAIALTERGRRRHDTDVRSRLHLASSEMLLDPPPSLLTVFFAWQSEFKPARNALFDAVPEVVGELNDRQNLLRPLELVRATEPGEGALRIDVALQEKIKNADYFVGDLTSVYAYKGRLRVNENVLVEAGFALASKPPSRIVLLAMRREIVEGDGSPNPQPAFDLGHVRRLEFSGKVDARSKLLTEIEAMLRADGWFASGD